MFSDLGSPQKIALSIFFHTLWVGMFSKCKRTNTKKVSTFPRFLERSRKKLFFLITALNETLKEDRRNKRRFIKQSQFFDEALNRCCLGDSSLWKKKKKKLYSHSGEHRVLCKGMKIRKINNMRQFLLNKTAGDVCFVHSWLQSLSSPEFTWTSASCGVGVASCLRGRSVISAGFNV